MSASAAVTTSVRRWAPFAVHAALWMYMAWPFVCGLARLLLLLLVLVLALGACATAICMCYAKYRALAAASPPTPWAGPPLAPGLL